MSVPGATAVAAAFLLSLALVWVALRLARARSLYDLPGERSSHDTPTPRIGGIGISLSTLVIGALALVYPFDSAGGHPVILAPLAGGLVAAATGLADDLLTPGLRPRTKYFGQLVAACVTLVLLAWFADGVLTRQDWRSWLVIVVAVPLAMLWQTAMANFTNFMDGADGLVAGVTSIILVGYAVAEPQAFDATRTYALVCAASTIGFLILNRPPAKIFMGDGGSLFLGHTIAAVGIWVALPTIRLGEATPISGIRFESVLAALILTAPLWVDPVATLALRLDLGRSLSQAHRDHLYQRMIRRGATHARVTLLYCAYSLLCVTAVLIMGWLATWGMLMGIALIAFGAAAVLGGHRLNIAVAP